MYLPLFLQFQNCGLGQMLALVALCIVLDDLKRLSGDGLDLPRLAPGLNQVLDSIFSQSVDRRRFAQTELLEGDSYTVPNAVALH